MLLTGSPLEEMSPDSLVPIVKFFMEHECHKAAVMVIDAMLVNMPNDKHLIQSRSRLEAEFDLPKALRSLAELIKLGVANASDYLLFGQLLFLVREDKEAASMAMSQAVAICEPSDRFMILVDCAHTKGRLGDLQGAVQCFIEADSLGQLDFEALRRLGGFQLRIGDAATAVGPLNRAALMDPSDGTV